MENDAGFVLIPGAGMSDWLWIKLKPLLNYKAVSIPRRIDVNNSENRLNAKFTALLEYANKIIDESGLREIILVGHSGAGLLAGTLAKTYKKVKHVVFVAANIPKDGTTAIDALPEEIRMKNIEAIIAQAAQDKIPMKALEPMLRSAFCNTCTEDDIAYILEQEFQPEPVCVLKEKMNWTDFPNIGKTYIVCTEDKTLQAKQQEILASNLQITDIRRIASDHMVMISHPGELARELNGIAGKYF
jgi:pimeloyl-ACP methyl ester carboxylesterase